MSTPGFSGPGAKLSWRQWGKVDVLSWSDLDWPDYYWTLARQLWHLPKVPPRAGEGRFVKKMAGDGLWRKMKPFTSVPAGLSKPATETIRHIYLKISVAG